MMVNAPWQKRRRSSGHSRGRHWQIALLASAALWPWHSAESSEAAWFVERLPPVTAEATFASDGVLHVNYEPLIGDTAFASDQPDQGMLQRVERPPVLREPPERVYTPMEPFATDMEGPLFRYPMDPPLGYTGPSGVLPSEGQQSSHFVPLEDRWRMGFPEWDRYGKGHPPVDDYPFIPGRWWDPYKQNVLKGDYPMFGQHTFLNVTATSLAILEARQVPTATTPFESEFNPFRPEFFGNPNQFFYTHFFKLSLNLVHGDGAFKPIDWQIKVTPIFNVNYLDVEELAVVNPDVRAGTTRARTYTALEEYFFETKLADLSPDYDFVSLRAGSQFFTSDFRGFIFSDTNRAVRLFGNRFSNRDQFNVILFDQTEKDTNSQLNTFDDRHQNTLIANYYRQDFIWPGYTTQLSVHYNRDEADLKFDKNNFLVRPDPVGVFQPHTINSVYLGWAGDGHINRFNINHAYYWVLGHDELNPLAGKPQDINAQMAAIEVSYDRDWARFRTSFFWASGDGSPNNEEATGFDSIFDNPNFAGGEFSYWQRQTIGLFGVNLVNRMSLVPDLRSSKFQGQTNFVNPGLFLANFGFDADITPKLKYISNINFLWFEQTETLELFTFQDKIAHEIGTDLSIGLEYRPLLNNNAVIVTGVSGLLPGSGFQDLYSRFDEKVSPLAAGFMEMVLTY
jgi:hypothetical protein